MLIEVVCFTGILFFNWILITFFLKVSPRLGLQDIPNNRSSHDYNVVRGGGFIFAVSWFVHAAWFGQLLTLFNLGLLLLFLVGIWDDIKSIRPRYRLFWQFVAMSCFLLDSDFSQFDEPGWFLLMLVCLTYLINVFNFMDGMNGMLGLYCLTILISLGLVGHLHAFECSSPEFWIVCSLLAFLFFNARPRALMFAGDVGSLTLSFIVLSFLFKSDFVPADGLERLNQFVFSICCVAVFLLDSFTTIVHRLMLGEHIFKSHRFHLYQLLTPRYVKSQLVTSLIYGLLQLLIVLCSYHVTTTLLARIFLLIILASFFFLLRYLLLKSATAVQGR